MYISFKAAAFDLVLPVQRLSRVGAQVLNVRLAPFTRLYTNVVAPLPENRAWTAYRLKGRVVIDRFLKLQHKIAQKFIFIKSSAHLLA